VEEGIKERVEIEEKVKGHKVGSNGRERRRKEGVKGEKRDNGTKDIK
jgi:hypothetical protein